MLISGPICTGDDAIAAELHGRMQICYTTVNHGLVSRNI